MSIGTIINSLSEKAPLLFFFWLIAILVAILIAISYQTESKQFFGIAGSVEKSISFQYPVEIVDISVLEGEKVRLGELLLEVRRYDLAAKLAIVEDEIAEISARKEEAIATTTSEIRRLEAEKRAEQSKLDVQLGKLESELKLNAQWANSLSNSPKSKGINSDNVLAVKLSGLKQQRIHSTSSYQATIDNLQHQLSRRERPEDAKLAMLQKRKLELERQVTSLTVNADFSGRVGSVLFARGEQVPMFSPILTLQGESTSFIKAYIHEAVLNEVKIGQKVWVESLTADNLTIPLSGRIESLGNRIVEYPERLKRSPLISAWGREVIVELDSDNSLLLGEKVVVRLSEPKSWDDAFNNPDGIVDFARKFLKSVYASEKPNGPSILGIDESALNLMPGNSIEASGVVWDPLLNSYIQFFDGMLYLTGVDSLGSNSNSGLWQLNMHTEELSQIL